MLKKNINHCINRTKDDKWIFISLIAEKSANKIQQSPMIKVLEKIGIHETKLNIIKSIYRKPQPQHNTQSIFTRIINSQDCYTFFTPFL